MARLSKIRARATYANVTATLALFVALGGGSFAVPQLSGLGEEGGQEDRQEAVGQADHRARARALRGAPQGSSRRGDGGQQRQGQPRSRRPRPSTADLLWWRLTRPDGFHPADGAAELVGDLAGVYPNPTIADDAVRGPSTSAPVLSTGSPSATGDDHRQGVLHPRGADSLNFPSINAGTCSALTVQRQGAQRSAPPGNAALPFADTFTLTGKVVPISLGIVQYKIRGLQRVWWRWRR